jgi:hypothetical protein
VHTISVDVSSAAHESTNDPSGVFLERLLLLLVVAVSLAAVDQAVKLTLPSPSWAFHQRSELWFVGSCLLLVAATPLARIPSTTVAIAAGIFCGGVLGNVLSASQDALEVPNPIVIGHATGGIAFNVADLFILSGNLLLMGSLIVVVIRNRDRLPLRQRRQKRRA